MDLLIIVLGDHDPVHALARLEQYLPDGAKVALDLADHDVAGPSAFQFDDELPGPVVMVKLVLLAAAREPEVAVRV